MTKSHGIRDLFVILSLGVDISAASAQFNQEQKQIILDAAASICNAANQLKGRNTYFQIEAEVNAQLRGVLRKISNVGGGGRGSLSKDEFEGLTRDATAAALAEDRGCRERVFMTMFDKFSAQSPAIDVRHREMK